jgi:hypothetical protein
MWGVGLEGQGVLGERVQNRIYMQGVATPEDLSLVVMNAERSISYVLKSLSESLGVGQGYMRWTEPLADERARLVGAGFEYQRTGLRRIEPKLGIDIWRNPDGTHSAHLETSTTWCRSPGDRMSLSFAPGAKGGGYLFGFPISSGVYVNAGAGIRF